MTTLRTALVTVVFGVVAVMAPAEAEETRYNFSSELRNQEIAADSRDGGNRSGVVPFAHSGGPEPRN